MSRRILVALLVTLLVVQPATAAAGASNVEEACSRTDGNAMVGVLPGSDDLRDDQILRGDETVYLGTTLQLGLCKDGDLAPTRGSEWSLSDSSGLEILDESDATLTVRVTGDESEIDFSERVSGPGDLSGASITVQSVPTVDSALTDGAIEFESEDAANHYETTERKYLDALANHSDATEQLNESAAALDTGEGDPETVTEEVLPALNESRESVAEYEGRLEDQLYETALESRGSNALTALSAAQEREQAARADEKRAMNEYLTTLESAERDAKTTVLVNLVGAAFVGLVVGVLPGWKLTASKLADIRFDRQVNSSVSYGPRVLARAGGLALVALVLTLTALVALGGLGKIGGLV